MRNQPYSPASRTPPGNITSARAVAILCQPSTRRRAINALGIDPATITIRLDATPARRGCWALAINETILLAPQALSLAPHHFHELLGHELCHIAQHRRAKQQGAQQIGQPQHARASHERASNRTTNSSAIEAQAERWGVALRDDRTPPDPLPLPASPHFPRAAVWIGGQRIKQPADLPTPTEAALALIPRATAWLKDAAASQAIELSFPDPPEFLLGVLRGLYATDLIFLKRAQAYLGPRRLLELSTDTIDELVNHESNEATNDADAPPPTALSEHNILTASDFAASFTTLNAVEAADAPIFQIRRLNELIRLHEAIADPSMPDAQSPLAVVAIRFALDRAATIAEFADALTLFLRVAETNKAIKKLAEAATDATGSDAERAERLAEAEAIATQAAIIWETLIDAAGTWLLTPAFGFPVANPAELTALLRQHLEFGQSLGFQSPSAGARQTANYLAHNALLHTPTPNAVRAYIERAQRCITEGTLGEPSFTQDGMAQNILASNQNTTVELMVDAGGCITLESFNEAPAPSNSTTPSSTRTRAAAHKKR